MPIAGLSNKRRFSRGGKIRLGEMKVSERTNNEYPSALDYMLFDPEDESLKPVFAEIYGEKPRKLVIAFASENLEDVFPQYYKLYASGEQLLCKGDGEKVLCRGTEDCDGLDCLGPKECPFSLQHGVKDKQEKIHPGCDRVASLQFFLPDLPVMNVWQIDTGSIYGIINVNSQLDLLRRITGRISLIPIELILKPQSVTIPETGKKKNAYVLDMIIPVGLRNVGVLKPLITYQGMEAPPPSEALPNDLYPRSQTRALPGPNTPVPAVEAESATAAEADTAPSPTTVPTTIPTAVKFEDDHEIQDLMAAAGYGLVKRKAVIASAVDGGWGRDQLIEFIKTDTRKTTPAPTKTPPKAMQLF